MQTGINLVELAQKIETQKAAKKDYVSDTEALMMQSDGNTLFIEEHGQFGINKTAHDQIAGRLNIPRAYYDRMRTEAPDLLSVNVNRWFSTKSERRMVRTLDGNVRAFLSDRYQRIDNHEIAEVALPVLMNLPEVKIVSSEITEHRMYIQAVTPRTTMDVKKGDAVQAGVIISNSEIGAGAVSVSPLVYRLVCLNGMVMADQKYRAYHVGRKVEDNEALWADDTRRADDRAVLLKVRDMIAAAVDAVRFRENVEKMAGLTAIEVKKDAAKAVELLSEKVGANEGERASILTALIKGGDLSAWGMINAVTAQAHSPELSYDRAVEFETAGGQLLNLPQTEWRRILEAA